MQFFIQSSEDSGSESETEQPKETEKKQKQKSKVCTMNACITHFATCRKYISNSLALCSV